MEVRGIVFNEFGQPLLQANVYYVDPNTGEYVAGMPGTTTGINVLPGAFVLPFVDNGQIAVSYIGYETQFANVYPPLDGEDHIFLEFNMEPSLTTLPEVVITPENGNNSFAFIGIIALIALLTQEK